ncbi:uncharacterized protein LOC128920347 [Zeugodacus cucurbitae]|uniref:uncharacterized protein LOC128920347 n=1 Tax=Zeugodacus cucurbitae TaxID=28588 RepID=UPI0023D935C8|nr:uncharacterized protein LOC128920347 [Zeugodacus cucurbitae]
MNQWPYLKGLALADDQFGTSGTIDILIGADVWGRLIQGEVIGGGPDEPFAQRTRLGWVVFGPAAVSHTSKESLLTLTTLVEREDHHLEELEDLAAWQSENNQRFLADTGTHWHFITPSAPHQGGIWEAAVKSAKHHLIRCVGTQVMWYSQLQTLAVRIEACLNSRPITPLYDDPEDKLALTPGDFLIGSPLLAVPEPDIQQVPSKRLKQWQWIRQLHQRFWDRWSEEYLTILQRRNKWQRRTPNIRVKDIVLVKQENMPPSHWCLGRVISVHPGADGAVRNVTLRTSKGYMNRAVQKLCLLLENEDFESVDSTGQDV